VSVEAEVDVGFLGQGEVVGIENEGEVTRGWRPLPRVECTRYGEYHQGKVRQGEWQTKVVLVIPEMERYPRKVIANVVRFRPRTNREVLAPYRIHTCQAADVSAPGKAYVLLPNL
jgi:hypothetical protein